MPALARVVGLWGAVWMGLGSILGTGVFVTLGIATGIIGAGVVLAVVLAAVVATANGLSSAQLAAAHPESGGTYEYGYAFVHPLAGFAAGLMFLAAKSASAATAALGCSGYLLRILGLPESGITHIGLALAIILLLTALVASGVRRSSQVNSVIVALTLATLAAFVVFGCLSIDMSLLAERVGPATWRDAFAAPDALLHATALIFVAYAGYGRIATLGEEVREPARTIPSAIIITLGLSMLVYVSVSATAVAVVGADAFAAASSDVAATLVVVAQAFRHPEVARIVATGAVTALAGVLLNLLLGLSRVLLAMARRHDMPAVFCRVHAFSRSPVRAVWATGALVAVLTLLGDVKTTWSVSAFTVLIYYGITHLAALRLPRALRRYPTWIAILGLMSCFGLASFIEWQVALAGLALLGASFVVRALSLQR